LFGKVGKSKISISNPISNLFYVYQSILKYVKRKAKFVKAYKSRVLRKIIKGEVNGSKSKILFS